MLVIKSGDKPSSNESDGYYYLIKQEKYPCFSSQELRNLQNGKNKGVYTNRSRNSFR